MEGKGQGVLEWTQRTPCKQAGRDLHRDRENWTGLGRGHERGGRVERRMRIGQVPLQTC